MGLFDGDPTCRFCRKETETAQHIICCSEALARQCYNVFGNPLVEPKDTSTASVRDLCLFIRGTGLLNVYWLEYLDLYNKPKVEVHLGHKLVRRRRRRSAIHATNFLQELSTIMSVLIENKCFKLIQGYTTYNTVIFTKNRMCYRTQKWTLSRSGFYIPASRKFHKALKIHPMALASATAQPNRTSYNQILSRKI